MYRKILKKKPGAYIFQRPFSRGLFLEGLICGGVYLRREICVSKSIGVALWLKGNWPFLLCCTLYLRAISKYKPPEEGWFNGAFFAFWVWGAYIWRGLYMEGLIFGILRYCTLPCPHTKRNKYNKKLSCRLSFTKENNIYPARTWYWQHLLLFCTVFYQMKSLLLLVGSVVWPNARAHSKSVPLWGTAYNIQYLFFPLRNWIGNFGRWHTVI